jgi:uncharacterized protein YbgA (DUF1722 family)
MTGYNTSKLYGQVPMTKVQSYFHERVDSATKAELQNVLQQCRNEEVLPQTGIKIE